MIVITGASGKLGRHVLDTLLQTVPASQLVAAVRDPASLSSLSAQGVAVRAADYNQPSTLSSAFAGAHAVLLISSNDLGGRVQQHRSVIAAAREAGVRLLAYTSILHADTSTIRLAEDHRDTEQAIRDSGIPFTFLRNGWYLENYTENLAPALQHGGILGSAGNGRIAAAARADYAAAAAAVLSSPGHENQVYELAGDTSFTLAELAAEVSRLSGKPVTYRDLPTAEYAAALVGFGLPQILADRLADSDTGIARGELDDTSHTLRRLLGRPTQPLADALRSALSRV